MNRREFFRKAVALTITASGAAVGLKLADKMPLRRPGTGYINDAIFRAAQKAVEPPFMQVGDIIKIDGVLKKVTLVTGAENETPS